MQKSIKIAIFSILSLVMVQAVQASEQHQGMNMSTTNTTEKQQLVSATGVVKAIDLENKKITIAHEAIPAIGWPAMTMRFTFTQQNDSIKKLTVGSQVNFSFIQQGNISLLQDINVSAS